MTLRCAVCLTLAGTALAVPVRGADGPLPEGQPPPGWFAFAMNPAEAAENSPADVSSLNRGPADQRILAQDGHFVREGLGPVRFLGTNVTFSGAFPDKDSAPGVAARLAQLGFNVVRFHHMDARDIWLPGQTGLDPARLDRLDWFLYQLKRHGVYANLNLHVSRTYPGLPADDGSRAFRYGKALDIFHGPFIALQEQYAKELLDRVNPYTGLKLTEDPVVAFVELNNENTLLALGPEQLTALPGPEIAEDLRRQWGEWLARRYADTAAAAAAWNAGVQPLGEEMLRNPRFEGDFAEWTFEGKAPGVCEVTRDPEGGVRVTISREGRTAWAYQVHQIGLPLDEGAAYTIRVRARARPARRVSISLRLAAAPWTILSGSREVRFGPEWEEHTLVVQVRGVPAEPPKRLSFNLGNQVGEVWFAEASLRPGRELFRPEGLASLTAMPLPGNAAHGACWADFRRFLIDTERAYVTRLRGFLRERLGVRALIVDTQASYGGYWGLWREASLCDYIDMHAYWQHPSFPGRPWDPANWTIGNTSMTAAADGGTFRRLAAFRCRGMPFSVSEYNHPAPNDHAAELFPLVSVMGALQDWDAVYQFAYCNRSDGYGPGRIESYFELCHHPAQLVFAPLAALIFRQGLVPPAEAEATVTVPLGVLEAGLEAAFLGPDALLDRNRVPTWAMLGRRFAVTIDSTDGGRDLRLPDFGPAPRGDVVARTRTMHWTLADGGLFAVTAPAARVAVGRLGGRTLALGDVSLRLELPDGEWACAALASADGKPLAESRHALLAVVTRAENSGMIWDKERRSVGRNWGREPVLVQAVPLSLEGTGSPPRVTALDARGARGAVQDVRATPGGWRLEVAPTSGAPWYVLERP